MRLFQTDLRAFHNDSRIKAKFVKRVKFHRKADEIKHGIYWENGKGCAVGCTVHNDDYPHLAYETELGIPIIIARLEDHIFENLTNAKALDFPLQFLQAIPVGADLSLVWPRLAVWMLEDEKHGVLQYARDDAKATQAIRRVTALYQDLIDGKDVTANQFENAADAAYAAYAVANAADAADAAYAAYAVADAAYAVAYAAYAVANAAYAVANAAYGAGSQRAFYEYISEKLLRILGDTPVPSGN
jgi:hypothetical protein